MNGSGIFISTKDFSSMEPVLKSKIQDWLDGGHGKKAIPQMPSATAPGSAPDGTDDEEEEEVASDLSVQQAKKLLEGCADKTKAVLREIFSKSAPTFILNDVAKVMKTEPGGLGGVWAGITKRTRTVLGDKEAALFVWEWDDTEDHWVGTISDTTFHSMRKALAIQ
jgi:hypothetical protein